MKTNSFLETIPGNNHIMKNNALVIKISVYTVIYIFYTNSFMTNMGMLPRLHFLTCGMSPMLNREKLKTLTLKSVDNLISQCFKPQNFFVLLFDQIHYLTLPSITVYNPNLHFLLAL